jgi:hypothetical protein
MLKPSVWRRRINNRASARRVRQKREEDLQRITTQVASALPPDANHLTLSSALGVLSVQLLPLILLLSLFAWSSLLTLSGTDVLADCCILHDHMQVASLDDEKNKLLHHVAQTQANCAQLASQLKEVRDRWQTTCMTNVSLYKELMHLRGEVELWQVRP